MCWAPPLSPGDMQARQPVLASLGGTSQTGSHLLLHEPTAPVLCSGAAVGLRAEARETLAHPLPDRPLQASLPHGALQGGWGERPQTVLPRGKLSGLPDHLRSCFPLDTDWT